MSVESRELYSATKMGRPLDRPSMAFRKTGAWSSWVAELEPGVSKMTKSLSCGQGSESLKGTSIPMRSFSEDFSSPDL